jgi:hypothetical protein
MAYAVFQALAEAGLKSAYRAGKLPSALREATTSQKPREMTRHAFLEGLKAEPTLTHLRVLRRAGLANRFRGSPSPVSMEEFFKLLWPKATKRDIKMIIGWTRLKDAYNIIHDQEFRGSVDEMREVFQMLDKDGDNTLTPAELERARIFTSDETTSLFKKYDLDGDGTLDFHEFCNMVQPSLTKKYVSESTKRQMQKEAEEDVYGEMRGAFGFGASGSP